MVAFPSIAALARADLGDALKCWEGLGYYARCRNLYRAAQTVMREHGGRLPDTRKALLAVIDDCIADLTDSEEDAQT